MKIDNGQKMFAGSVASALVRAWTERLGLRVVVDPRDGKSSAELTDDTGRVVWSQAAEGAQLELPLAAPQQPVAPSPGAPADAPAAPAPVTPSAEPPSPVLLVECPADPSLHPQDWADDLDLSFFPEGLVRWEMSSVRNRPGKEDESEGTAWTFVPRAVGDRIWERLAETGTRATLTDADPDGEVMLLAKNDAVAVRGQQWQAISVGAERTVLVSLAGEEREVDTSDVRWIAGGFCREVDTSDVRWIAGGFCCVAPPPKEKAAKKASKKSDPTGEPVRLWIAEATWDALGQEERELFAAYAEWQGTEGYVFADVPAGKPLVTVRNLARDLEVQVLDYAPRPELAPKKTASKGKGKRP